MPIPLIFAPTGIEYRYERAHHATNLLLGIHFAAFLLTRGDIPPELLLDPRAFELPQLLTSGFLHADGLHLIGNMVFLFIYGPYVEERLGSWKFVGVYAACELSCNLAYLAVGPLNPTLGASGAISGLMGFVMVAAPFAEVRVFVLIGYRFTRTSCIAFVIVGIWLVGQFLLLASQTHLLGYAVGGGGIAVSAHLGGCAAGMAIAAVLRSELTVGSHWHLRSHEREEGEKNVVRLRRARQRTPAGVPAQSRDHSLVLLALRPAARKAKLIKLVMKRVECELEIAIERITNLERGTPQTFYLHNALARDAFAREATRLGAYLHPNHAKQAQGTAISGSVPTA